MKGKTPKNVDVATRWKVILSLRIFLAGFNGANVQGLDFEQRSSQLLVLTFAGLLLHRTDH